MTQAEISVHLCEFVLRRFLPSVIQPTAGLAWPCKDVTKSFNVQDISHVLKGNKW
jgi:hypothetical protein